MCKATIRAASLKISNTSAGDNMVHNDFARPAWWKIVQMYRTTGVALLNSAFGRML
ncbi:MAG TPA: hypothetical protein VLN61_13740 [Pseudolabrys sp.]|nr:hypothetical protein [Pseudolabrys sp.]